LIFRPSVQGDEAVANLIRVLFFNAAFALMFIGSGALFRMAGAGDAPESPARTAVTD
jgi:hypothetical protein